MCGESSQTKKGRVVHAALHPVNSQPQENNDDGMQQSLLVDLSFLFYFQVW
jgi:hypothetical protein